MSTPFFDLKEKLAGDSLTDLDLYGMGELDPADMHCAEDYADDLGNLVGEPKQFFVEGDPDLDSDGFEDEEQP